VTYADFSRRAMAHAIDAHLAAGLLLIAYLASEAVAAAWGGASAWLFAAVVYTGWLAVVVYNRCVLPGRTGQSWGRRVLDIRLVAEETRRPVGVRMAMARELCHAADVVVAGIGFLLPLWDPKRQTIADKLARTVTVAGSEGLDTRLGPAGGLAQT
jgi:uncharacterized RDD family membrane protein YckC